MRPEVIVVVAAALVEEPGLEDGVEDLAGEQFVAGLALKLSTKGFCQGEPGSM